MPVNKLSPPYYAVIFSSLKSSDDEGYVEMLGVVENTAKKQEGFLGIESARGIDGYGITVSYWKDLDSIEDWKNNIIHIKAKELGKQKWYERYSLKIAKVEIEY